MEALANGRWQSSSSLPGKREDAGEVTTPPASFRFRPSYILEGRASSGKLQLRQLVTDQQREEPRCIWQVACAEEVVLTGGRNRRAGRVADRSREISRCPIERSKQRL